MDSVVTEFLKSHEVGCLATEIEGGLHGAAIHYTLTETGTFYVRTDLESRKCSLLKKKGRVAGTFVVGFSFEERKTYQADGEVRLITDPAERQQFAEVRAEQFPGKSYYDDLEVAFLEFTPAWWRYTDMGTKPNTIIEN